MKKDIKLLLVSVVITFLIANLFSFFINTSSYINLKKIIMVPGFLFPIVWSLLYLLMGISLFIILKSKIKNKDQAIKIYFIQLLVNSLWTLIFFKFNLYLLSAIWIIILLLLVINMIIIFLKINLLAGVINIPYVIWLLFALILNISIIVLN